MTPHRVDPFSLVAGLLFSALGFGFLLDELDVWTADIAWVPAVVLIVLGIGGVLAGVLRARPAAQDDKSGAQGVASGAAE